MQTKFKTEAKSKPTIQQLELIATLALEGLTAREIAGSLSDLDAADARAKGLPTPAKWHREEIQRIMIAGAKARAAAMNAKHLRSLHAVGIVPLRGADGRIRYGCDEEPQALKKRKLIGRSEHNQPRKAIT